MKVKIDTCKLLVVIIFCCLQVLCSPKAKKKYICGSYMYHMLKINRVHLGRELSLFLKNILSFSLKNLAKNAI